MSSEGRYRRDVDRLSSFYWGHAVLLAYRMHFLQVKEASKFRMLADENRINIRLILPARGKIFDRNGILLAGNKQNFRVSLIKDEITNLEEQLTELDGLFSRRPNLRVRPN